MSVATLSFVGTRLSLVAMDTTDVVTVMGLKVAPVAVVEGIEWRKIRVRVKVNEQLVHDVWLTGPSTTFTKLPDDTLVGASFLLESSAPVEVSLETATRPLTT